MDIEDTQKDGEIKISLEVCNIILNSLIQWVDEYDKTDISNLKNKFITKYHNLCRLNSVIVKKSILTNVLRQNDYSHLKNNDNINLLKILLQKKPSRNISGITSITVLTSPHPNGQSFSCKHNCYFCPNEPAHEGNNFQDQPRSYLYDEPAVRRANRNKFLPIEQMNNRMDTLFMNGHEIDKLDIILEGGTYTEYPPDYLEEYHRDLFYAANTYYDSGEKREKLSISEEMKINETSKVHIIGISIETRPDAVDDIWLRRFREWGVTRIQIGIQHTDNKILKKINRGHTIEQAIACMKYLKDNCFKIHIHIMPDLPNSTPEMDKAMFDFVYKYICPDEMKIYPCQVVPWTMIEKWNKAGKYTPYSDGNINDLIDVIKYAMLTCPEYVRFPRVVRDIPSTYISAGNHYSNLRQMIDNELNKENKSSKDIRTREIGRHPKYYSEPAHYNITKFEAHDGIEYFIQYESWDKEAIFGFLRLRFPPKDHNPVYSVLKDKALIRELHVYGTTNSVGSYTSGKNAAQHKGIGTKLLKIAENIARRNFYSGIVVISGEGVKCYYRKRGYVEIDTYMVKEFIVLKHLVWFHQLVRSIHEDNNMLYLHFVMLLLLLMLLILIGIRTFVEVPDPSPKFLGL